jgi:hypothetical protein
MAPPGEAHVSDLAIRSPADLDGALGGAGPTVGEAVEAACQRQRRVEVMAMTILLLNVLDLLVTQYLLRTHAASHEGNALLSRIVLSPWAWVPKIGLPAFVLATITRRPVSRMSYVGLRAVYAIYWAVVWWNIHILFT